MSTNSSTSIEPTDDAPHSKGRGSRAAILLVAAKLATVKGFAGLSIGDLAAEVGMSKSGLYAHFKSKEELELATIETAIGIFDREVLQHAAKADAGVARLRAITKAFLSYLERKVFPGGCFFAAVASELDTRTGPVRDKVIEVQAMWLSLLKQCITEAQAAGELDPRADVAQVAFELGAMLVAANFKFVMTDDTAYLAHGRRGVENTLARYSAPAALKKPKRKSREK